MKRRLIFGFVALLLAANLVIGAKVYNSAAQSAPKDTAYPSLKLYSEVLEKIRRDYVDGEDLTYKKLVYSSLKGMISSLDPHSEFMEPESFQALQDDTEGHFGGLGIVIALKDGYITVVAPMEDSPGFNAGILAGDRITEIEGKSTKNLALSDAVKNLRGEPGTSVKITVNRPSNGEDMRLTLTRAVIKVDMVKDINGKREFPLGDDKIGYVRLVQFGEKTSGELEAALRKLKKQGLKGLVLDLRWNPGGLLEQAVEVCEKFLPRGQLVVSTEGRNKERIDVHKAGGGGDELVNADGSQIPMVVLVNGSSASASEIVSGCLQDLRRAVILGENTFGKGSVQSIVPLEGGAALRLTTAKYYTPSHKVIHEVGITPNVEVLLTDNEEKDILLKRMPGGIDSLDEKERARLADSRDPQLDRATDLLKGILMFTERNPAKPSQKMAALPKAAK